MRDSEDYIGNIRTFHTRNFTVSMDAYADWDTDLSFDESGETRRKIEHGDLISFYVTVTVTHTPTGLEIGRDSLGGCIYESIEAFQDHRECAKQTRRRIRRNGRFQVYRKNRKYESILSASDKLRKRGFATRERAEEWAKANTSEPYEIFETGVTGSYFSDMIHEAISEARQNYHKYAREFQGVTMRLA